MTIFARQNEVKKDVVLDGERLKLVDIYKKEPKRAKIIRPSPNT